MVLTGTQLGNYGRDLGTSGGPGPLLAALLTRTAVPRIRLSSLQAQDINESLLRLWDDTHFTVLFVTHSIPEAITIGNRILLLSARPGQVKAELNSVPRAEADAERRKALEDRIHHMLFADQVEEVTAR